MLSYQWHDFLGNLGAFLIVGSYFLLQIRRISGQSRIYSLINAAGATLVLISLYFEFNLSAAVVELLWLIISLLGLVLGLKQAPAIDFKKDRTRESS